MKQLRFIILLTIACVSGISFTNMLNIDDWTPLFNGKDLSGWDTYLGPAFDSAGNKVKDQPPGLNNDPKHVFAVVEENGEKVIRISGENFGAITSKKDYENYHLQLMFKWGSLTWIPKKNKKKDSGLLYHAVGPDGADGGFWMRSQECQIQEGDCGDYWGVAGATEDVRAIRKSDSEYVYNPGGQLYTFSANSKIGRRCIKNPDAEKPSGEWNTIDLYVHGDTSVHVMNGTRVMVLYHSSQFDNGKMTPLAKGKLQIQSEGAEVFYKHIMIKPLNEIPRELLD